MKAQSLKIKMQIEEDFIKALKAKDESLSCLRMLKNAIKNAEIEKGEDLKDTEIAQLLQKEKKQRQESITEFKKGDREDLVKKEQAEIKIIEKYLPKQISGEEIKKVVTAAISELGAKGPQDMSKVMGKVMPQFQGKADGAKVSQITKSELDNLS